MSCCLNSRDCECFDIEWTVSVFGYSERAGFASDYVNKQTHTIQG